MLPSLIRFLKSEKVRAARSVSTAGTVAANVLTKSYQDDVSTESKDREIANLQKLLDISQKQTELSLKQANASLRQVEVLQQQLAAMAAREEQLHEGTKSTSRQE